MEKFTKWEDKSCGINPFVPVKRRPKGWLSAVVGAVQCPVKALLLCITLTALSVAAALEQILVVAPLKQLFRFLVTRPLARLVLFSMGYFRFQESVPDVRRLRLGKLSSKGLKDSQLARARFGSTVKSGDVILMNYSSVVEVLYSFWRFGGDFALIDLTSGDTIAYTGVLSAIRRALWVRTDASTAPAAVSKGKGLSLSKAVAVAKGNGVPLIVFPEGVRTNGRAVLQFLPVVEKEACLSEMRIHLVAVEFVFHHFCPSNPVLGAGSYLFWSCMQLYNQMNVNLVPHELRTADKVVRENVGDPSSSLSPSSSVGEDLRALLAACVGNRGVKTVQLGASDYFSFLEYYAENATVKRR